MATPLIDNLVHETSTTTGTGNFTLSNVNGKRSFNTAFSTGGTDKFYYFISNQSAAEYEWGTGHLSASTTLVRDTIIGGSNGTSAVNFGAGTKDVTCDMIAAKQVNSLDLGLGLLLTSGSVSSAASLSIVLTSYTAYRGLIFVLSNFIPATDGAGLWMRLSTDGGSTYDASAANYMYNNPTTRAGDNTLNINNSSVSATKIVIGADEASGWSIGNGSSEGMSAIIYLLDQTNTAVKPRVHFSGSMYIANDDIRHFVGAGLRNAAQDTDAVQFLMSSGNIASGKYAVYGVM